jgi:hypothetical protein
MNLIYTFDKTVNTDSHKIDVLKSYYTNSINSAKLLGYKTELYSNCDWFDDLVDIKHIVTDEFVFWDAFKTIPLNRNDDYILVDGDVIFHNRLPKLDDSVDVYFDGWESWLSIYDDCVNELDGLGISDIIPEWKVKKQRVMNIGTLKINNHKLKELYLDRWFKLYEFCKVRKNSLSTFDLCCTITSQYLLTILSDGFNTYNFSNRLRTPNEYYTHYVGKEKYNLPIPRINKTLI